MAVKSFFFSFFFSLTSPPFHRLQPRSLHVWTVNIPEENSGAGAANRKKGRDEAKEKVIPTPKDGSLSSLFFFFFFPLPQKIFICEQNKDKRQGN